MLKKINPLIIQFVLFILTVFTATLVGASWVGVSEPTDTFWTFFSRGFDYSIPFLGILTVHEFGHYLMAKHYKVEVTLPYYIPLYLPFAEMIQIGTMGAFIRMKGRSSSRKEIFDIGVAGPLAGFFAALIVLFYGFTNLPEPSYIFKIHPEYEVYGKNYADSVYTDSFHKKILYKEIQKIKDSTEREHSMVVMQEPTVVFGLGKNLLFLFFEKFVVQDKSRIPNSYEMYHYPFIFAGYLALFFTALNLIPIGQLDGGHIIYGLFGYKKHKFISRTIFTTLIFVLGLGIFKDNILNINFFTASYLNMLYFAAFYLSFLYFVLEKTFKDSKTVLMISVIIFAAQFLAEIIFPKIEGGMGLILFAILIGRFMGVEHPPAMVEEPLDFKRKLIGWTSLVILILCFTPQVFTFNILK
ncbi:MAG TPA: site-2 protease family protein, partial [Cytophagaceae bacterium]|jgi:membrane-associated protease RseP (regulator of RpoE activity)|nr:site-2 protease family protein [Cytophagaceae bacterium]